MLSSVEILILSAIQGISEFLPVSSAAHLVLVSKYYAFVNQNLLIDICLHLGSLLAIIFYFRNDLFNFIKNKNFLIKILIGTIPIIPIGYIIYKTGVINDLRTLKIIGWTSLIFGILLYISDKSKVTKKIISGFNNQSALFIGIFQILSLIPGMSRSGTVITGARFLGFTRTFAIKLALLTSIPVISLASCYGLYSVLASSQKIHFEFFYITSITFLCAFFSIKFLLKWIKHFSFRIFVIYRLCLGVLLIILIH